MNQTVLVSLGMMGGMGVLFGAFLAYSARKFTVATDERIKKIEEVLPGANCGSCGYPGCSAYARAIVNRQEIPTRCPVGGQAAAGKIGEIMGVSADLKMADRIAAVKCQGGTNCTNSFAYQGIHDCSAAALFHKGPKSCKYGCIGMGSCLKACPFNAIIKNRFGAAEIDVSRCTGCGVCVKACPKGIIELVPAAAPVHVLCKNGEPGKIVKPKCQVGCIGCKACERVCESKAIKVAGHLAAIDYGLCTGCLACVAKCPVKAIKAT